MSSNLGKWDRWYSLVAADKPEPYGDSPSYQLIADEVENLDVADWGCGKGWLRTLIAADRYRGVDGSHSPFADEVADLAVYVEPSEAVVLRHVLEHDARWQQILRNAASAAERVIVIVLFTPTGDETRQIAWNDDPGVPDLSFDLDDILRELDGFDVQHWQIDSPQTQYGVETMIVGRR